MYSSSRKFGLIYLLLFLLLLSLDFYNIFYHLGKLPVFSWDEARHGVSAYEMLKQRNFIVNTYQYKNDYWNLKPPLSFWAVMAGFKLTGFNPLGLRLMSAIGSILTILMTAAFVHRIYGRLAAILSALVLSTCPQLIIHHSARTGDADALFVLFFTVSMLSLLLSEKNDKWLYLSGIAFALAFLTKSWHAGTIVVIMGLYLLLTGKMTKLPKCNRILILLCMIVPILIWAIARYQYDGFEFFKEMIVYDLLQRSSTSIEGHIGGKLYYVQVFGRYFGLWLAILFGLVLLYSFNGLPSKKIKSENSFYKIGLCLWALIPFLLFTIVKTKIKWYILPAYVPLSIIIGVLASRFLQMQGKYQAKVLLFCSILFAAFHYHDQIHSYLHRPVSTLQLSLLEKVQGMEEVRGYSIFLHRKAGLLTWQQNEVLAAELYGDLHAEYGDLQDFLKKKKALLLLQKGPEARKLIATSRLQILASNKWGYIVQK